MAEQFLSLKDTKTGAEILRSITNESHTACIVDVNNVSARKYSEYIYKYKAPNKPLPDFMIGEDQKRIREDIKVQKSDKTKTNKVKVENKVSKVSKVSKENKVNKIRLYEDINFDLSGINPDPVYKY